MLCVLPCDVLLLEQGQVSLLHLQSMLTDTGMARLLHKNCTERALACDRPSPEQLLPIHEAVSAVRAFLPVERDQVPALDLVERFLACNAQRRGGEPPTHQRILHSHGALQCLLRCLELLREDGFLVCSDYGSTTLRDNELVSQHQHFGVSTAMGLNFPLLEFAMMTLPASPVAVGVPDHDSDAPVHSRLLSRRLGGAVTERFPALFDGADFLYYSRVAQRSQRALEADKPQEALQAYQEAEAHFSQSWLLHTEWAHLCLYNLRDPQQALEHAHQAAQLNPTGSSRVWNVLGDALYMLERYEDAHEAFLKALAINPEDPRSHLNLAWTRLLRQEQAQGLRHVADGLALDQAGHYRDALLEVQGRLLGRLNDMAQIRTLLNKARWH
jgi:tetratricopeptide (TPR) repeat protein